MERVCRVSRATVSVSGVHGQNPAARSPALQFGRNAALELPH